MDIGKLGIDVDTSNVRDATEALNELTVAAEKATSAIQKLTGSGEATGLTAEVLIDMLTNEEGEIEFDRPIVIHDRGTA